MHLPKQKQTKTHKKRERKKRGKKREIKQKREKKTTKTKQKNTDVKLPVIKKHKTTVNLSVKSWKQCDFITAPSAALCH